MSRPPAPMPFNVASARRRAERAGRARRGLLRLLATGAVATMLAACQAPAPTATPTRPPPISTGGPPTPTQPPAAPATPTSAPRRSPPAASGTPAPLATRISAPAAPAGPTAAASPTRARSPQPAASPQPAGRPTPVPLPTSGPSQAALGGAIYGQWCIACHGPQGEGGVGPRLIGAGQNLARYGTAQGLFDFVSVAMPQNEPRALSGEQYWQLVAFILARNGLLDERAPLAPQNAAQVRIR
ncbi:MAG: cytochrome c [Chloroflexi bacterium]|nr:cytochrome c [Chloroflexota bacterium]